MRTELEQASLNNSGTGLHLGVFVEPFLRAVIDGRKTIESRFAKNRCAPYGRIGEGDFVFLKRSAGPVIGVAKVGTPEFHRLDESILDEIRELHAAALYAEDDAFWADRKNKNYATLIPIEHATPFDPFPIRKKDRRGWVTYREHGSLV